MILPRSRQIKNIFWFSIDLIGIILCNIGLNEQMGDILQTLNIPILQYVY